MNVISIEMTDMQHAVILECLRKERCSLRGRMGYHCSSGLYADKTKYYIAKDELKKIDSLIQAFQK